MTLPLAIPPPTFGLQEQAPVLSDWSTERAGFYCVAETATATDAGRSFGTPTKPRRTIPSYLPAGSAVAVLGTLSHQYTSPNHIRFGGVPGAPVFIKGFAQAGSRFAAPVEVAGNYGIVESMLAYGLTVRDDGAVPASHVALRDLQMLGDKNGGGIGIGWNGSAISDVLVTRCRVTGCGDLSVPTDIDHHGITVGACVGLWLLDNELDHNSGDGVQLQSGRGLTAKLRRVFAARNHCWENRQHGLWVKYAADVVLSENDCHGHVTRVGGIGAQIGAQYGPANLWIINNRLHDGDRGVGIASYDDGSTANVFVVNNRIWKLTQTADRGSWAVGSAVHVAGGALRLVSNNTIVDATTGLQVPAGGGPVVFANNISTRVARRVFTEGAKLVDASNLDGDPGYEDDGSFRLKPDSPARNSALPLSVSMVYQQLFGVPFDTDAVGVPRGIPCDLGAMETP